MMLVIKIPHGCPTWVISASRGKFGNSPLPAVPGRAESGAVATFIPLEGRKSPSCHPAKAPEPRTVTPRVGPCSKITRQELGAGWDPPALTHKTLPCVPQFPLGGQSDALGFSPLQHCSLPPAELFKALRNEHKAFPGRIAVGSLFSLGCSSTAAPSPPRVPPFPSP